MSRDNLQGVDVHRVRAGFYIIEGWTVVDVKGTTGWRLAHPEHPIRWAKTLSDARSIIARTRS